jgi:hypothetical protein
VHVKVNLTLPVDVGVTLWVPLVASFPDHPSLAAQVEALVLDQVRVAFWPAVIVVGATDNMTVGARGGVIVFPLPP